MMDQDPQEEPTMLYGRVVTTPGVLCFFGIVGIVGIAIYAFRDITFLSDLFIISIASLITGGLMGFLFGIPRTTKKHDTDKEKYRPNTNLEEISDWLTKIIVGLGLVEIDSLKGLLHRLLIFIRADAPHLPQFVILLFIVYFSIYGFFFCYLMARIYSAPLFARSDERTAKRELDKISSNIKIPKEDLGDYQKDVVDLNEDINFEDALKQIRILENKNIKVEGVIYKKYAMVAFFNKNYGIAKEFFLKSYKLDNDLNAYCNYGVVIGKYFDEAQEANHVFETAIELDNKLSVAYYNLACNKIRQGYHKEGIEQLKVAFSIDKDLAAIAKEDKAFEPVSKMDAFTVLVPDYQAKQEDLRI